MKDRVKINPSVTVGKQPDREQFKKLADEGFKSVLNIRAENEPNQPIKPRDEGEMVEAMNLEYRHFPMPTARLDEPRLDEFRRVLMDCPKPVYVHDETGVRAGVLVLAESTAKLALSSDDCMRTAKNVGIKNVPPDLETKVRRIIDARLHRIDQERQERAA